MFEESTAGTTGGGKNKLRGREKKIKKTPESPEIFDVARTAKKTSPGRKKNFAEAYSKTGSQKIQRRGGEKRRSEEPA